MLLIFNYYNSILYSIYIVILLLLTFEATLTYRRTTCLGS